MKSKSCKPKCKIIDRFHLKIFISVSAKELMRKKSREDERTLIFLIIQDETTLYNKATVGQNNLQCQKAKVSWYLTNKKAFSVSVFCRFTSKVFWVFTSHVIQTKNRNHSMTKDTKVKNLGYDRRLIHKQPLQALFSEQKLNRQFIFWPARQPSRGAIFKSRNAKAWKFKRALLQKE